MNPLTQAALQRKENKGLEPISIQWNGCINSSILRAKGALGPSAT